MVIPISHDCLSSTQIESLSETTPFAISITDTFGFGKYWEKIKPFVEEGFLYELIQKRRQEIETLKEEWRVPILSFLVSKYPAFYNQLNQCLQQGTLQPIQEGFGGAYLLANESNAPCFIIKPIDEDIYCLNNSKQYGTPFNNHHTRVSPDIALYRSCQASSAAASIARLSDLGTITPDCHLAIIATPQFYDLSHNGTKEKLCSVQEYIADSSELYEEIQKLMGQGVSDHNIGALIDQNDFERAMIFIWICFDNDAHAGNFRTYTKTNGLLGLKKIDNDLTFPEKNRGLNNCLALFPNAERPLSSQAKALIKNLPLSSIIEEMVFYGLDTSIEALQKRVLLLHNLIDDSTTLKSINQRLSEIEK